MPRIDATILFFGAFFLILAVFITGCSVQPTKIIRITEYAAESPITSAATMGGCSVESSEESPIVSILYEGDKCQVSYGQ